MTQLHSKTDHELRIAVEDELAWAPQVDADRVGVSVQEHAVTLSGQVRTYPEKQAAVAAALRVRGVTAVADELAVEQRWTGPDDIDIAGEATKALENTVTLPPDSVKATVHDHVLTLSGTVIWEFQLDANRIQVSVEGREVTLRGTVSSWAEKRQANHTAWSLPGVAQVHNLIAVKP